MKKLGFGGMRLPLLDPDDPTSIDQKQLNQMTDAFLANGFTYFDTAYPYHQGCAETAFKTALTDRYPRNKFLLADKMPTFQVTSSLDYEPIFQTQLERCGVDFFDFYLLHNLNRHTYQSTVSYGGFEFMTRLKSEGRIRHMGLSFHDTPEMLDDILTRYPEMEFVQLQLNYIDWNSPIVQARQCYDIARKHQKPIIVMEPVKGGSLAKLPKDLEQRFQTIHPDASCASWAIRYAASLEGVLVVLSGMSSLEQILDNLASMHEFQPLSLEETKTVQSVAEELEKSIAIPCTNCRYCVDTCPKHLDIPGYFSIFNAYQQYGMLPHHIFQYQRQIVGHGKASECISCGRCESHCPQHISIPDQLKQIADAFELQKK